MKLYKVTAEDGSSMHGGSGKWRKGRWRSVHGEIVPCENGLHLCRADHLVHWIGPVIWEVETDGEVIDAGDKMVARRARVVRRLDTWTEQSARHFAADCAEDALQYADPEWRETLEIVLHTVRAYADGEATEDERQAAESAAEAAARSAASAAAELAALSAEQSAAESAAWSAAWSAAELAAESAAELAAWSAWSAYSAAEWAAWSAARSAASAAARSAASAAAELAALSAEQSAAESKQSERLCALLGIER